jgi:hypothetical protein
VDAGSIQLHGAALYSLYLEEGHKTWTYLPYGPFDSCEQYLAWLLSLAERREGLTNDAIPCAPPHTASRDICQFPHLRTPLRFFVMVGAAAHGVCAFLRTVPSFGCIEIGHVAFAPVLRRTTAATEAIA